MESILSCTAQFSQTGQFILAALLLVAVLACLTGLLNLFAGRPRLEKLSGILLIAGALLFTGGFCWIAWFHYQLYLLLPLELPAAEANWLNVKLRAMNNGAQYALPLYDQAAPPRFRLPLWIENTKYFFWFFCYAVMACIAHFRLRHHRLRGVLAILFAVQVAILYFVTDPFTQPLPKFFAEIEPWFAPDLPPYARIGLFMSLYPRMIFYYNAHYMWFHPPMLFVSYACITLTFVTSVFMLVRRELAVEQLGYEFAKLGYFMLTLGMLLGYPWALKAWGPNWWWDPKICASIMMWAVYSTYLHTRLYANKRSMWYFSSFLGILCFGAMLFTLLASFFFPGEHTMQ